MTESQPYKLAKTERERQLFDLIAAGDEITFKDLFHLYVPMVQGIVVKLTRSETVVPDLVQDIF